MQAVQLLIVSDSRKQEETTLNIEGLKDATAHRISEGSGAADQRIVKGKLPVKLPPLGMALYVQDLKAAGMIDDAPAHWTPMLKNTCPRGWWLASGA